MQHNHPGGMCLYCLHALPALLPQGAALTIVPPDGAMAPNPWWIAQQVTFTGNPPRPVAPAELGPGELAVYSLGEAAAVSSPEALAAQLELRVGSMNHFAISPAPAGHPLLTMMVNGDAWVVHYFASPNDPGSIACDPEDAVRAAGRPPTVEMPDPSGMMATLPDLVVLDQRTALSLAAEYASSWERPTSIGWAPVVPADLG